MGVDGCEGRDPRGIGGGRSSPPMERGPRQARSSRQGRAGAPQRRAPTKVRRTEVRRGEGTGRSPALGGAPDPRRRRSERLTARCEDEGRELARRRRDRCLQPAGGAILPPGGRRPCDGRPLLYHRICNKRLFRA